MARSAHQRRYLQTNSPQTGFEITAGRKALNVGFEITATGILQLKGGTWSEHHEMIPLDSYRGIEFEPFGTGADNSTFNYRMWLVVGHFASGTAQEFPKLSQLLDIELLCFVADTSTVTLSAAFGVGAAGSTDSQILTTERIGDGLTCTLATDATSPKGPATAFQNAYTLGDVTAYSPADDTPSRLIVPDFGCALGVIPEMDLTGATGANWMFKLNK